MAFCSQCGTQVPDGTKFCPNCGAQQQNNMGNTVYRQGGNSAYDTYGNQYPPSQVDNGGLGWGLLGFCIPIVGLILFLVWKDSKPRTAKAAGMGALISVLIGVLFYALGACGSIAAGLML